VKDFGEYLWFGFPPEFANGSDSVVIASSCAEGTGDASGLLLGSYPKQ